MQKLQRRHGARERALLSAQLDSVQQMVLCSAAFWERWERCEDLQGEYARQLCPAGSGSKAQDKWALPCFVFVRTDQRCKWKSMTVGRVGKGAVADARSAGRRSERACERACAKRGQGAPQQLGPGKGGWWGRDQGREGMWIRRRGEARSSRGTTLRTTKTTESGKSPGPWQPAQAAAPRTAERHAPGRPARPAPLSIFFFSPVPRPLGGERCPLKYFHSSWVGGGPASACDTATQRHSDTAGVPASAPPLPSTLWVPRAHGGPGALALQC